jgi:hypothetical protein
LAIDHFEFDEDVISSAADQRMSHVRSFQAGKHSDLSQRILNEIAAARVCLLDPDKKREYDRQLRQRTEPAVVPRPVPMARPSAPAVPIPAATPVAPHTPTLPEPQPVTPVVHPHVHHRHHRLSWQVPAAVGAAVAAFALLITFIVVSGTLPDTESEGTAKRSNETNAPAETEPPPEAELPPKEPEIDPFEFVPSPPVDADDDEEEHLEPTQPEDPIDPASIVDDPAEPMEEPVPKIETVEETAQRLREQYSGSETDADLKTMADALLVAADRAIVVANTDLAKELVTLALTASRRSGDAELTKTVTLRFVELQRPLGESKSTTNGGKGGRQDIFTHAECASTCAGFGVPFVRDQWPIREIKRCSRDASCISPLCHSANLSHCCGREANLEISSALSAGTSADV